MHAQTTISYKILTYLTMHELSLTSEYLLIRYHLITTLLCFLPITYLPTYLLTTILSVLLCIIYLNTSPKCGVALNTT